MEVEGYFLEGVGFPNPFNSEMAGTWYTCRHPQYLRPQLTPLVSHSSEPRHRLRRLLNTSLHGLLTLRMGLGDKIHFFSLIQLLMDGGWARAGVMGSRHRGVNMLSLWYCHGESGQAGAKGFRGACPWGSRGRRWGRDWSVPLLTQPSGAWFPLITGLPWSLLRLAQRD